MNRSIDRGAGLGRRAVAGLLAAVALLGAGACGSSSTKAPATSLEAALGFDEKAFRAQEPKVQEEVRKCMKQEGFEYVAVDLSQANFAVNGPGGQDDPDFRRTKGYGITTTFGDEAAGTAAKADPNQKIREALGEADQKAYDTALYGAAVSPDGEGSFIAGGRPVDAAAGAAAAPTPEDMGCFGRANAKVRDPGGKLQRLGPKLDQLQQRMTSDPRIVKADAAWAKCMKTAGFTFKTPDDIPSYLFEKLSKLEQADNGGAPDGASKPPDPAGSDAGSGGAASAPPPGPGIVSVGRPVADSPELAALQKEELSLAATDHTCATKTKRQATFDKVRAEVERQFLQDNPELGKTGSGNGKG